MLRSEASARRQILLFRAFCFVLSALILSSCGFRPVYGPAGEKASSPVDQLANIRIEPLQDRDGQQLHNYLRDRLNPNGQPMQPAYRLEVLLSSSSDVVAFREDATATRTNLTLRSKFVLRSVEDGRALYSDQVEIITSYNLLDAAYPTIVARSDAVERGLLELSDDITLRLAVYFSAEGEEL